MTASIHRQISNKNHELHEKLFMFTAALTSGTYLKLAIVWKWISDALSRRIRVFKN